MRDWLYTAAIIVAVVVASALLGGAVGMIGGCEEWQPGIKRSNR